MKLFSINNELDRLERQRAQERIQRLRDAARETLREATMTLTPCPRCHRPRLSNDRPCERCYRAAVRQVVEHRPSDFARAFVPELGDHPQGTRVMSLREQGAVAREHGDAAIRYGQRARLVMARSLEDDRQAHGISPNLAVAISCLIAAVVLGALWWAQPESGGTARMEPTPGVTGAPTEISGY